VILRVIKSLAYGLNCPTALSIPKLRKWHSALPDSVFIVPSQLFIVPFLSIPIVNRYGENDLLECETLDDARGALESLLDEEEIRPSLSLHNAIVTLRDALESASS
jgi:hypothetical protein